MYQSVDMQQFPQIPLEDSRIWWGPRPWYGYWHPRPWFYGPRPWFYGPRPWFHRPWWFY